MSFHCIALHCLTYYTDNRYSTTTHLHCPNNNIWLIYNIKLSPARRMQQRLNVVISALLVLVLNIAVTAGRDGGGTVGVSKECFIDLILNIFYYWVDMCLVWTVNSQQQLLNCVAVPSDSDCKIRERSNEPVMSSQLATQFKCFNFVWLDRLELDRNVNQDERRKF